jgi:hypothetical protein
LNQYKARVTSSPAILVLNTRIRNQESSKKNLLDKWPKIDEKIFNSTSRIKQIEDTLKFNENSLADAEKENKILLSHRAIPLRRTLAAPPLVLISVSTFVLNWFVVTKTFGFTAMKLFAQILPPCFWPWFAGGGDGGAERGMGGRKDGRRKRVRGECGFSSLVK